MVKRPFALDVQAHFKVVGKFKNNCISLKQLSSKCPSSKFAIFHQIGAEMFREDFKFHEQ